MNTLECIKNRRSVRAYAGDEIKRETINRILEAGTYAPSGKNGQPWRFFVVHRDKALLRKIAAQTVYFPSVIYADCLILVFLDKVQSYHFIKDVQAIGACMENMLLAAEELGLGACWNGEILRNDVSVKEMISLDKRYDLMAMMVLGYPAAGTRVLPIRKKLEEVLLAYE